MEAIAFGKPWNEEETWEEKRPEIAPEKPEFRWVPEECVTKLIRSKAKNEPDGIP